MVYWTTWFCNFGLTAAGTSYTVGTLPTGSTASFDFTVGTTLGCTDTGLQLTMMTVQILMMDLVSIHVQTTL